MSKYEFCRIVRIKQLHDLEIVDVTFTDQIFPYHFHDTFSIGVVLDGLKRIDQKARHYEAGPGTAILMSPKELHEVRAGATWGWRNLMLYPSVKLMAELLNDDGVQAIRFREAAVQAPLAARTIRRMARVAMTSHSLLEMETVFASGLQVLVDRHGAGTRPREQSAASARSFRRALEYLHANLCENLSLGDLADVAGCGRFKIIAAFKEQVGLPPHAYQTQLRIALAQRLLRTTRSVADVAMRCGFFDQSHLNRHFKKHVGVPPLYYRSPAAIPGQPGADPGPADRLLPTHSA